MPVLFDRTCILCGRVLPAEKHSAALCPDCAREVRTEYRYHGEFSVPGADGAAAALCYRGAVKEALHRFKFGGRPQYAAWFAAEMAAVLAAQLDRWQPTCITYLPLGFLRARERGYNQAELLAKAVAEPLSLPCRATLRKRAFTPKQSTQKNAAARQKNAERALLPRENTEVRGKSIVLVDDIITTGATAATAVNLLREMGAIRVYVLAAARTSGK